MGLLYLCMYRYRAVLPTFLLLRIVYIDIIPTEAGIYALIRYDLSSFFPNATESNALGNS
jgi:hypothetical protein